MAGRKESPSERMKRIQACDGPEELIAALDDPSPLVVEAAARRLQTPRAAAALARTYRRLHEGGPAADPGCWARMALIEALARIGAPEGEDAARLAVRTVQVEPVGNGMVDTATGLRVAAAGMLANLGAPGALLDLAWLLFDFDPDAVCSRQERPFAKLATRVAAATAIGQLGDPAGAAVLALKLTFRGEEVGDVVVACMDALAALKEPRLGELLDPYLNSPDGYLCASAGLALAAGLGAAAVPRLVAAVSMAPNSAKEALVLAVAGIRAEGAREAIRALAEHADPVIRRTAEGAI